jgi:hypothetical protein
MGETFKAYFSDAYGYQYMGVISGSAGYARMPNAPGTLFRFKSYGANNAPFYFGFATGSVVWPVAASEDTGWFPGPPFLTNLNQILFRNASGTSEKLVYWVMR